MIDSNGNQCPLIKGYFPCRMETEGKDPDWYKCSTSTGESFSDFEESLKEVRVFPAELWPLGPLKPGVESRWGGISLRAWYDYITAGKPLFPDSG
jgi:hypothetical protein